MKVVIRVLLLAAIAVMCYLCVMSIVTPIQFDKTRTAREKAIISRLIDIRKAEIAYKDQKGHYTADADSLVDFIVNGKIANVLKEGVLTDEQLKDGLTEKKAVKIVNRGNKREIKKFGLEGFRRDTTFQSVYDKMFKEKYTLENISKIVVIPASNGKRFEFAAKMHKNEATGIFIPLFEARAPFVAYLSDLNKQELINLTDTQEKLSKYVGLKVGSIEAPNNNAGNWE